MSTPRRRLLRPTVPLATHPTVDRRLQRLRSQLEGERTALERWMTRLRRAFRAVEKSRLRVSRIERQIARLQE
jgi:hypothetical protein